MGATEDRSGDRDKWDKIYLRQAAAPEPAYVLSNYRRLLPKQGRALDLACGLGGNAILLAKNGLQTCAWDISPVAISKLLARATEEKLNIDAAVRDAVKDPPSPESFDVIVVSRFLARENMPQIIAALRQNGLLLYQTFTAADRAADRARGPSNPAYRLGKNELPQLCRELDIIIYTEPGLITGGNPQLQDQALLIGRRRRRQRNRRQIPVRQRPPSTA